MKAAAVAGAGRVPPALPPSASFESVAVPRGASSIDRPRAAREAVASRRSRSPRGVRPPVQLPSAVALGGLQEQALDWMDSAFGCGWADELHPSHRVNVAIPLAYCTLCFRHAGRRQNLQGLRTQCKGPPGVGSTYLARQGWIERGRHPVHTEQQLRLPSVPVLRGGVICERPVYRARL